MKFLKAAILAASLALASSAHAASGTWGKVGNWEIIGDTDVHMCLAKTIYEDGVSMGIAFDPANGASFVVGGTTAAKGQLFNTTMMTSTGAVGKLIGIAIGDGTVAYKGINKTTLRNLRHAQAIFIEGLGTYRLTGSSAAMVKAWECYEALNSF